jgi:hypothetical protein
MDASRDVAQTFLRAEQSGLKLAIIGRIAALALMGIWLISTRADDPARAVGYVLVSRSSPRSVWCITR